MGLATRLRFSHRMTRLAAADPAWSGSAACDLSTVGLGQAPADAINSTAPAWQPPKQPENHALLEPIWDQDDTSGLQVLLQGMLVPRISRHTSKKVKNHVRFRSPRARGMGQPLDLLVVHVAIALHRLHWSWHRRGRLGGRLNRRRCLGSRLQRSSLGRSLGACIVTQVSRGTASELATCQADSSLPPETKRY